MQSPALTGQHLTGHGLTQQDVTKEISLVVVRNFQDGVGHRVVKPSKQVVVRQAGGPADEQIRYMAASRERHHLRQDLADRRKPNHARKKKVVERRWKARPRRSGVRGEELFREERIALRSAVDVLDEPYLRRGAKDCAQQLLQLVADERFQEDPVGPAAVLELPQESLELAIRVVPVGPVRDEEEDAFAAEVLYKEREEVSRRPIAPLGVLDRQDHGLHSTQAFQQHQNRFEQSRLGLHGRRNAGVRRTDRCLQLREDPGDLACAGAELRDDRLVLASHGTQRLDDRRVGKAATRQLQAAAEQGTSTLLGHPAQELGKDSALPDARLAAQEDCTGLTSRRLAGMPGEAHRSG